MAGGTPTTSAEGVCPHCGAKLQRRTVVLDGKAVEVGWIPCQCDGAKAARAESLARAEAERLRAEGLERLDKRRKAGVPGRFAWAESERAPGILAGLSCGRGAYVTGGVGSGKTHLACAVANLALDEGMTVWVGTSQRLLGEVKAGFGEAGGEDAALHRLATRRVLVVDDLGKEQLTEWSLATLFRVVDARWCDERATLFTSQLSVAELARRWARQDAATAQALASRIAGSCDVVDMGRVDRRMA